ncbi:transposase [Sediminicoccus sp. KRV36]|uniref:transposase n=1 Tax=Sediminicoccus sp. KRV36 TaxID=3133721 RepID=UPI00200FD6ED|nr:transposase [Sediminicoccus rosea]UPY36152.1 transposase [Sediminicoccus rosea]
MFLFCSCFVRTVMLRFAMRIRPLLPPELREPRTYSRGPRPPRPARILVPYDRMTDAQWSILSLHLPVPARGRPCDQRARMDAIFRVAATEGAWRELPAAYGKGSSVARHFQRLANAGVWERLLRALAASPAGSVLREMEGLICRAARRAIRIRGLALIMLARRLKLMRALPGPSWMVADPDLSENMRQLNIRERILGWRQDKRGTRDFLRILKTLHTLAGGRASIPRTLRECWK